MENDCPSLNRIERFLEAEFESAAEQKRWESHVEICEQCRDALYGHQELIENLGALSIPQLSPLFDQELQAALDKQKTPAGSENWKRLLLQSYWLLALGASFMILDSLDGAVQIPSAFSFPLAVSGTLALLVLRFALKHVQLGFLDLVHFAAVDPKF
jgi:hypothetical protein